jgi:hypothetical protein
MAHRNRDLKGYGPYGNRSAGSIGGEHSAGAIGTGGPVHRGVALAFGEPKVSECAR